jgi:hypothetical protein
MRRRRVEHEGWRIWLGRGKGDGWCGRQAQRSLAIERCGRRSIPGRSRMLKKGEVVEEDGIEALV